MNWIDTPLLVYSRVEGHPAQRLVSEALEREQWASSVLALLEVYQALRVDYGFAPSVAGWQVEALAASPIDWVEVDIQQARTIAKHRRDHGLGGPDAALFMLCAEDRGVLFTLDSRLLRVAREQGLVVSTLINRSVMDDVVEWEEQNLPQRGLPRLLRSVKTWIEGENPGLASRFIEASSGLTRLPV